MNPHQKIRADVYTELSKMKRLARWEDIINITISRTEKWAKYKARKEADKYWKKKFEDNEKDWKKAEKSIRASEKQRILKEIEKMRADECYSINAYAQELCNLESTSICDSCKNYKVIIKKLKKSLGEEEELNREAWTDAEICEQGNGESGKA